MGCNWKSTNSAMVDIGAPIAFVMGRPGTSYIYIYICGSPPPPPPPTLRLGDTAGTRENNDYSRENYKCKIRRKKVAYNVHNAKFSLSCKYKGLLFIFTYKILHVILFTFDSESSQHFLE